MLELVHLYFGTIFEKSTLIIKIKDNGDENFRLLEKTRQIQEPQNHLNKDNVQLTSAVAYWL